MSDPTSDAVDRAFAELLRAGEPAAAPEPAAKTKRKRRARRERYYPAEPCEYEPGAVVELRSGGPAMTVWKSEPATMEGLWPWMYWCHWFVGDEHRKESFPGHVLRRAR